MLNNKWLNGRVRLAMAAGALLIGPACGSSSDGAASTPAATPQPEETAVSTPSPTAATTSVTDADPGVPESYVEQAEALMDELAEAATAVAEIMGEADVESETWREDATTALGAFEALHEQAEGLDADGDVQHIQERLLVATETYYHAAALLSDSIESLDLDALEEANIALGEALVATAEVRLLIEEFASS